MTRFTDLPLPPVTSDAACTADAAVMQRMQSGDASALPILMERHWTPLVAYAGRVLRRHDDAEDIVQEAFVRLWDNRAHWKPGGSVRSYLFTTARNLMLGWFRHLEVRQRTEPEVRTHLSSVTETPLQSTARSELREALIGALEALPPRRREALVLVRIKGYSLAETAEIMKLSRQTVANHVSLALDDLEKLLGDFRD
jgi:RNA polymerase sigma-70 factor, ECF subfamily